MSDDTSTITYPIFNLQSIQNYDLMLFADGSISLSRFIQTLKMVLPQIFYLIQLTNIFNKVSILTFSGDNSFEYYEWCDWNNSDFLISFPKFLSKLETNSNKENDETDVLNLLLSEALVKIKNPTIGILFAKENIYNNLKTQIKKVKNRPKEKIYNWLSICHEAKTKNLCIFSIITTIQTQAFPYYYKLSEITEGVLIYIDHCSFSCFAKTVIGIVFNVSKIFFRYDTNIYSITLVMNDDVTDFFNFDLNDYFKSIVFHKLIITSKKTLSDKMNDHVKQLNENDEYTYKALNISEHIKKLEMNFYLNQNILFSQLSKKINDLEEAKSLEKTCLIKTRKFINYATDETKNIFMDFVEKSFFKINIIEKSIRFSGDYGPFYITKYNKENFTYDDIFCFRFYCSNYHIIQIIKILQYIHIQPVKPYGKFIKKYLPFNLNSEQIFQFLLHFICPGTILDPYLSSVIAILCVISCSVLEKRAFKYLIQIKGTWIKKDFYTSISLDMIMLLLNVSKFALTEVEYVNLNELMLESCLKNFQDYKIEVVTEYPMSFLESRDFIAKCKKCNKWRYGTLILDNGCFICTEYSQDEYEYLLANKNYSFIDECSKCYNHYEVLVDSDPIKDLICFSCIGSTSVPPIECIICKIMFSFVKEIPLKNYICPTCRINIKIPVEVHLISIKDYINQNNATFIGLEIENIHDFFFIDDMYSIRQDRKSIIVNITDEDLNNTIFLWKTKRKVLNVKDIRNQIFNIANYNQIKQCIICRRFETIKNMFLLCSNNSNNCFFISCADCAKEWYIDLKPGDEIHNNKLLCSRCKNKLFNRFIEKFNKSFSKVMKNFNINNFDETGNYGWCIMCKKIEKKSLGSSIEQKDVENFINPSEEEDIYIQQREKIREFMEQTEYTGYKFKCYSCTVGPFRKCSDCNVLTFKKDGCNYIKCENINIHNKICNTHWCWICKKKFSECKIFRHMKDTHGGFYTDISN